MQFRVLILLDKWPLLMLHVNKYIIIIFLFAFINKTMASVTLVGTRIIYNSASKEKTLQFSNQDNKPSLVQIWVDSKAKNSSPDKASAPFIITPPIFRIDAKKSQLVRIMFSGKEKLPADRESVFYFNFLQVPAVNDEDKDKNKLLLMVTNNLKLFYRPANLQGDPNQMADNLLVSRTGNSLTIKNPMPFHANISSATIVSNNKIEIIKNIKMIAPFSSQDFPIQGTFKKSQVTLKVINDYGVEIKRTYDF